MSRTIDPILKDAMANGIGEILFRVNTWADQAAYDASPSTPDNVWEAPDYEVLDFEILSTRASAKFETDNDYTRSAFTVFTIERGRLIDEVEYTVESGLFFVTYYREEYGKIEIKGSSYPNIKIYIADGDGTYEEVITEFCDQIGKTPRFKNPSDAWLDYQFLETGKIVRNNKAERFESLIKQKYTILTYEESPGSLVFYTQKSYETIRLVKVAWSPTLELFAAISADGQLMTSTNGEDWTQQTIPEANRWNDICWADDLGIFCAVADTGTNRAMTSDDGETWVARSMPAGSWLSICRSEELGLFCAAGSEVIATSPTGATWTARTPDVDAATRTWSSACWSPEEGIFCIADSGNNGATTHQISTSPNGIDWTGRTAAEANQWYSICWAEGIGKFVAVAIGGTHRVMTSTNGVVWITQTAAEANQWYSVCWAEGIGSGLLVAVSSSGTHRVMTSEDGETWAAQTAAGASAWRGVCWAAELEKLVAVALDQNGNAMTSTDGENWVLQSIVAAFRLTYEDGPNSYLIRSQSEMHFVWNDENGDPQTSGDTSTPIWDLGFLPSAIAEASPPSVNTDPYYKMFMQVAPVRLDITDGDKIHFVPAWEVDPTQTIDAMIIVEEHFHVNEEPSWYQSIKPIILFDKGEAG